MKAMIRKRITAAVLTAALTGSVATAGAAALTPFASFNADGNDYGGYAMRWAAPRLSYLQTNADGTLTRVEYDCETHRVVTETYDSGFRIIGQKTVDAELTMFGGFYEGTDSYFILYGQANPDSDGSVEVYRLVRYDKSWNRLSSVSLYGANTTVPFDAGSVDMVQVGNRLHIRTCHEMYSGHQANVTLIVNLDTMEFDYQNWGVSYNGTGYVSHSFNQMLTTDGTYVYSMDHGDAYPRGLRIGVYNQSEYLTGGSYHTIPGPTGENYTGVMVGGFQAVGGNLITAGSSVAMDDTWGTEESAYNIFLDICSLDGAPEDYGMGLFWGDDSEDGVSLKGSRWVTSYTAEDACFPSNPYLLKLTEDRLLLIWSESELDEDGYLYEYDWENDVYCKTNETVCYEIVDKNGNAVTEPQRINAKLSDCEPVLSRNRAVWYVTEGGEPQFYSINLGECLGVGGFWDVAKEDWFAEPVLWAVSNHVTAGTSSTTFSPEDTCTRAHVVQFQYNYAGRPGVSKTNKFTDVADGKWYSDAVAWAVANNITAGTSNTTFSPDAPCTRAEVVQLLYNAAGRPPVSKTSKFTDVADGKWYSDAVAWAVENGITSGTSNTTFSPDAPCTRAEIVTFLYKNANH